jgi:UDP-N-acetylmuramate-alanine ligase
VDSLDAAFEAAKAELRPGTLVIVLGAGTVTTLAHRLAALVTEPAMRTPILAASRVGASG